MNTIVERLQLNNRPNSNLYDLESNDTIEYAAIDSLEYESTNIVPSSIKYPSTESNYTSTQFTSGWSNLYSKNINNKLLFNHLYNTWKEETLLTSSINNMIENDSFKLIIKLGETAIPLILKKLIKEPSHLIIALFEIVKYNPVKSEHRGIMKEMANDWIEWGKNNGYLE